MSSTSLPSYANAETPSYTAQPRRDEQTLGLAGRVRGAAAVDASRRHDWTKKVGHATLILTGQPLDSELPVYGRHSRIQGHVTVDSTEEVASVQLKLEGHVKCKTIAEIGHAEATILKETVFLWTKNGSPCPTRLSFDVPLPPTYTQDGQARPLPPSFEYTFYDVQGGTPGLKAKVKYSISVEVEHSHHSLKERLTAMLSTPFVYLPRTRPGKPPSGSPTTVFESTMEHRVGKIKEKDPIVWKLRLPPPGMYAITQPIPFRVTVTSRSSSLITPFVPTNKRDKAAIRVYVLRQVSIKINSIDLWRSYVIAEGKLTYLPGGLEGGTWLKNIDQKSPSLHSGDSVASFSERDGWAAHEWSGVLQIDRRDVTGGGFEAGGMVVKDFIVLSVVPPNPRLGDLLEVKRVVPILLTTDPWEDAGSTPPPGVPIDSPPDVNTESNGYLEGTGVGHHIEDEVHHNGDGTYRNGRAASPAPMA